MKIEKRWSDMDLFDRFMLTMITGIFLLVAIPYFFGAVVFPLLDILRP